MRKIALLFIGILSLGITQAQENILDEVSDSTILVNLSRPQVTRYLEIGVSANAYQGDLSSYENWSSIFHAGLQFNKGRKVNSRLGISAGFLTGENRFYNFENGLVGANVPNTFFRTNVFSLEYSLRYNLIKNPRFILYISQGIGFVRLAVKDEEGQDLLDRQETRVEDESYNNFSTFLPTSIGFNYLFKNGYGAGMQASILNTQTDYLDNIGLFGVRSGNDNVVQVKFFFLVPLQKTIPRQFPQSNPYQYSR